MKIKAFSVGAIIIVLFSILYFLEHLTGSMAYKNDTKEIKDEVISTLNSSKDVANDTPLSNDYIECNPLIYFGQLNDSETNAASEFVHSYFRTLSTYSNLQSGVFEYISIASGFGLNNGREIYSESLENVSYRLPNFALSNSEIAPISQEKRLIKAIDSSSLEEVINLIKEDGFKTSAHYFYNDENVFLLTLILKSNFRDKEEAISRLIDLNVSVHYADIVEAIRKKMPQYTISEMVSNSDAPPSIVAYSLKGHYFSSLLFESIKAGRYDLALYFLDLGSPASPDKFKENSLDLLVKQHDSEHSEKIEKIIYDILSDQVALNNPKNKPLLKGIISLQFEEKYALSERKRKDSLRQLGKDSSVKLYNFFTGLVNLIGSRKQLDTVNLSEDCVKTYGRFLVQKFRALNKRKGSSVTIKKPIRKNEQNINVGAVDITDTEESLAPNQTYNEKLLVEALRRKKLKQKIDDLSKSGKLHEKLTEENVSFLNKIYELMKSSEWNKVLDEISLYSSDNKAEAFSLAIPLAIEFDAPKFIFSALLSNGGQLASSTIELLIVKNNVGLAEFLSRFGLEVNFVSPMGRSSLASTVVMKKYDMLLFLLRNGAVPDSDSFGLDALDVALTKYNVNDDSFKYIQALLDNNYRIEQSHLDIVENWISSEPSKYFSVINRFPALKR